MESTLETAVRDYTTAMNNVSKDEKALFEFRASLKRTRENLKISRRVAYEAETAMLAAMGRKRRTRKPKAAVEA